MVVPCLAVPCSSKPDKLHLALENPAIGHADSGHGWPRGFGQKLERTKGERTEVVDRLAVHGGAPPESTINSGLGFDFPATSGHFQGELQL